jgi:hypothetical protein
LGSNDGEAVGKEATCGVAGAPESDGPPESDGAPESDGLPDSDGVPESVGPPSVTLEVGVVAAGRLTFGWNSEAIRGPAAAAIGACGMRSSTCAVDDLADSRMRSACATPPLIGLAGSKGRRCANGSQLRGAVTLTPNRIASASMMGQTVVERLRLLMSYLRP